MQYTVNVNKSLVVSAEQAWSAIAAIDGLDRWFPIIDECEVTGAGVGATRKLTLAESGGEIIDRIELIDRQQRCFRYNRIKSPFPVSVYLGTVTVKEVAERCSELTWIVEIETTVDSHAELTDFIRKALSDGIDGLERDLRSATANGAAQVKI